MSSVLDAKASAKAKESQPAKDYSFVEDIYKMVKAEVAYYPFLSKGPDAIYWIMATFGAESNWQLLHGKAPNRSSRHLTVVDPRNSSLTRNGYQNSNVIQNLVKDPLVTAQIIKNIQDGWYAHGISACMGTYHVRGCPNNKGEWRSRPEAVARIEALGLEVDPGQSIVQTLFPADTADARLKSVASGIVIFNSKYRQGLERHNNDTAKAMRYALSAYLGAEGARDANNTSPDDRRRDLNSNQGRISILKYIGLVKTGDTSALTKGEIDLLNKEAKIKGATKVDNNPSAYVAKTDSGAGGKSSKLAGCELS
jgi:hypothetical protein